MTAPDLELVYVGDPMCSWCWGFAPTLQAVAERFAIPLRIVVGGLRPGPDARVVDEELAELLGQHWIQVEEATGQPFDYRLLEERGWRYDTELACAAVVAVRQLAPEHTLEFFGRLQHAFYAQGVNLTDPAVYPDLVRPFVDVTAFLGLLANPESRAATWGDFAWARQSGITGFPTLVLRHGARWAVVTRGWAPIEAIEPGLRRWIRDRYGEETEGRVCPVGGPC